MNIVDPKSLQDVAELVQENMASAARAAEEFITDTVRRGTVTPDEAELAIAVHLAKNKGGYPSLMDLHDGNIQRIAPKIRDLMYSAIKNGADSPTIQEACTIADVVAAHLQYRLPGELDQGIFIQMPAGSLVGEHEPPTTTATAVQYFTPFDPGADPRGR